MMSAVLDYDGDAAEVYIEFWAENENGDQAVRISDSWLPGYNMKKSGPYLVMNEKVFSEDLANRLRKISEIISDGGEG